jgi:hypothetical protein
VSVWGEVFLGVIALATLASAVLQIAVVIAAGRASKRLETLMRSVEHDLKPVFAHMNAIGRDVSRTASLASAQVERVDQLFAELAERVDHSLDVVQTTVTAPVREGTAVLAGARAVLGALLDFRARSRGRSDEEDVLFI